MRRLPSTASQERAVQRWNERYPTGTPVRVRLDSGEVRETRTRSAAAMLSGHTAVIWLEGIVGCYLLERVTSIDEAAEALERR